MKYDFTAIEAKWHKIWDEKQLYAARTGSDAKKFYALVEFPYPSGAGLHVGHARPYTAMDVIARKHRMQGENVLFPMGYDAFGLPTENYAIKNHIHPAVVTKNNIANVPRPAAGARLQLRLGPRDQHDGPGVFQVDAVDLPAAL